MRAFVLVRMPRLSQRIHRAPVPGDDDDDQATGTLSAGLPGTDVEVTGAEWNWPDAEKRLTVAFEQGGFSGWAAAALHELEAEGEIERKKRGHS